MGGEAISFDQVMTLAKVGQELVTEAGHCFFREGDPLECFYLVIEGAVAIVLDVPDHEVEHKLAGQLTGQLITRDVVISAVGPGEVFGWSALVPPHQATTSAKATTHCRVIEFNSQELITTFDDDCRFGYLMIQKMAQVIRDRLRGMRIESLAHLAAS